MPEAEIKAYGYRWVVLAAFMFINLTIQMLWICFAPITRLAAEYFHASEMQIGMLAMSFMFVYVPLAIPASWVIDRFGFRKGVGLGAAQPLLLNSFTPALLLGAGLMVINCLLIARMKESAVIQKASV